LGEALICHGELSTKSINFGEVSIGNKTNRVLYIYNKDEISLEFHIYSEKKSIFSFSE